MVSTGSRPCTRGRSLSTRSCRRREAMGLKGFAKALPTRRNAYCGVGGSWREGKLPECTGSWEPCLAGGLGLLLGDGASFVRRWLDGTFLGLSAFFRRENCQTFGNELLTVLARL